MQFKKSLGQHFLIDKNIKQKIVNLLEIKDNDLILEIGPGDGALTEFLYNRTKNIILVEKDKRLIKVLKSKFNDIIDIVNADFLDFEFNFNQKIKIVGNLPYNVSNQIIFKVLENVDKWQIAIFMVQKEVAERIVAKNNSKDFSILSVICQAFCNVEKKFDVSKECFIPKPNVTSSVVKFIPKENDIKNFKNFLNFTKALFYGRRKKLINTLKKNPFMKFSDGFLNYVSSQYTENIRVENLEINDFIDLYKYKGGRLKGKVEEINFSDLFITKK